MSDPDFFIVSSLLGNVASFRASTDMRKGDRLVRLEDHQARIAELQAQVEQLRTEAKVASDRIQELGRFTRAQRGEIEGLRADLARTERNRDMWKEQCARQARQLECMHIGMKANFNLAEHKESAIDSARAGREDGNGR